MIDKALIRRKLIAAGLSADFVDDPRLYPAVADVLMEAAMLDVKLPPPEDRGTNSYVNGYAHGCGAMRGALLSSARSILGVP